MGDCTSSCAGEGTGESGSGEFGRDAALSADGSTAVVGAPFDEGGVGAAWVFKRSGSSWTQDGAKLVADCTTDCEDEGTGEVGDASFGYGVAISPDASTVMVGAPSYYEFQSGVWAFTPVSTATISNGPTSGVSQSGCTFAITGEQASLNVGTVEGCLRSEGNATITDDVPSSSIDVTSPIAGPESSSLTLDSTGSISQSAPIAIGTVKASAPAGVVLTDQGNEVSSFEGNAEEDGEVEVADSCGLNVTGVDADAPNGWDRVANASFDLASATALAGRAAGQAQSSSCGSPKLTQAQDGKIASVKVKASAPAGVVLTDQGNEVSSFEGNAEEDGEVEVADSCGLNVTGVDADAPNGWDRVANASFDLASATALAGRAAAQAQSSSCGSPKLTQAQDGKIASVKVKASAPAGVVLTDQGNEVSSFEGNAEEDGEVEVADSCGLNVTGVDADAPNGWDRVANASFDLASATALAGRAAGQAQSSSCGSPKLTQAQDGKIASVKVKASAPAGVVLTDQGNEVSSFEGNAEEDGEVEVADSCGLNVTGVDADAPNGWDRVANASFDLASATALAGRAAGQAQSSSCGSPKLTQAQDGKIASVKVKASAPAGVVLTDQGNEVSSFEGNAEEDGEVEVADSCGLNVTGVDADAPNGWDRVANASFDLASATALAGRAAGQAQSSSCGSPKLTQAQDGKIASVKVKASAPAGVVLTDQGNEVSSFEGNAEEDGEVEVADSCGLNVTGVDADAPNGWDRVANASFDLASATALAGRAAGQAQSSSCGSPKLTQAQDGKIASVKVKASAPAGVVLTDQGNEVSSFEGNAEEDGNVELEDASGSLAVTKAAPHAGWDTILGVKGTAPMGSAPGLTLKGPVSGADVVLKGDQMKLSGGSVTATGTAKLAPASPSQPIDLGAPRPDALSLVAADIDAVSAAKLVVGGATAGPVTVSAAIAPTKTDSLTLQTPAAVEGAGKGLLSVPQLALDDVGHAHTWTINPTTVAQGTSRALPYAGVTELTLEGEGGGDTVDATASASTTYSLDGGPSSDGILDYNAAGRPVSGSTSPPSGTIDSPGVAPVAFTRMASVNIANGPRVAAAARPLCDGAAAARRALRPLCGIRTREVHI